VLYLFRTPLIGLLRRLSAVKAAGVEMSRALSASPTGRTSSCIG